LVRKLLYYVTHWRFLARGIGRSYWWRAEHHQARGQADARKALVWFFRGLPDRDSPLDTALSSLVLVRIARASILLDEPDRAREMAAELQAAVEAWPTHGHSSMRSLMIEEAATIQGECALLQGDISAAADYLAQSVCDPPSDSASTIHPTFRLARKLVDLGEKEAVKSYFRAYLPYLSGKSKERVLAILRTLE
jgi:hypothetical protein